MTLYKDFKRFLREGKNQTKEKLKLPVLYVYIPLLVLHYWKPLSVFIFSNESIERRILIIKHFCGESSIYDHLGIFLIILLLSSAIAISIPYASWVIEFLILFPTTKRLDLLRKNKKASSLIELDKADHELEFEKRKSGKKEAENYTQIIDNLKITYENQINTQTDENTRLKNLNNELTNKNLSIVNTSEKVKSLLSENKNLEEIVNKKEVLIRFARSNELIFDGFLKELLNDNQFSEFLLRQVNSNRYYLFLDTKLKEDVIKFIQVIRPLDMVDVLRFMGLLHYNKDLINLESIMNSNRRHFLSIFSRFEIISDKNPFSLNEKGDTLYDFFITSLNEYNKNIIR